MSEHGEFRQHWRPLLASFIGLGSGLSLNAYILTIFAPYLIESFGWSLSQWASLGVVQMLIMFCLPVAGRLTDRFGVRAVAMVGALSYPLFLIAITQMDGSIGTYAAIYVAQTVICSTTTTTVYSRVVAEVFKVRRGIALGIAGSSPPLIAFIGSPLMSAFVREHGWREGYYLIAGFCAVCAVATMLLLGPHRARQEPHARAFSTPGAYRTILTMPAFWIMLVAIFLVNTPFSLATSQLKLVVADQGLGDATAALMVSAFAISSIVGRVVSGTALDYLPGHLVAAISFGLPVAGLLLLASPLDSAVIVLVAVVLIGASFGGEGDIVPYLITRHFPVAIYSTTLGLLSAAMGAAMGGGAALLSQTLKSAGGYNTYLTIAAICAAIGSSLFLLLGLPSLRREVSANAAAP
ncbi:MAG: nitrate/nitrite transporter [Novosphingobium sp.]